MHNTSYYLSWIRANSIPTAFILSMAINFFFLPTPGNCMNIKEYLANNKGTNIRLQENKLSFYDLELTSEIADETPWHQNAVTGIYKGKTIVDGDLIDGDLGKAEIEVDFPAKGMTTLILSKWNGGAWCCWGYDVFVKNGEHLIHTVFYQERSAQERNPQERVVQPKGRLRMFDHRLLHFLAAGKNNSVQFYPTDAPWLPRYAVFENNAWRVDNEGELAAQYKEMEGKYVDLTTQGKLDDRTRDTANAYDAIMRTFYCLMEGGPDERCRDVMQHVLTGKNSTLYKPLWAGVVEKVMCYKPIRFSAVY